MRDWSVAYLAQLEIASIFPGFLACASPPFETASRVGFAGYIKTQDGRGGTQQQKMAYRIFVNHPALDLFGAGAFDGCRRGGCSPHRGRGHHHGHHHGRDGGSEGFVPAADVYSTGSAYKVYFSLPSADKETIELTYDPNTRVLNVSGTLVRPAEFAELDDEALKTVLVQAERKTGRFERKIRIPASEDGERIQFDEAGAKFENGVLELTLPKVDKEEQKPKSIVIE
jgi:HSP20 family molecular chaperone IbpA